MPEVAILTPVKRGSERALREYLHRLRKSRSPCAELGQGTHFGRFVVIDIGKPHLLFTSRFDGSEGTYLADLADREAARTIWAHCRRPDPVNADSLRDYLLEDHADRVPASYVVSILEKEYTVARIKAAMDLQGELSDFAIRAEKLDAISLAQAFRELQPVRRIAEP